MQNLPFHLVFSPNTSIYEAPDIERNRHTFSFLLKSGSSEAQFMISSYLSRRQSRQYLPKKFSKKNVLIHAILLHFLHSHPACLILTWCKIMDSLKANTVLPLQLLRLQWNWSAACTRGWHLTNLPPAVC